MKDPIIYRINNGKPCKILFFTKEFLKIDEKIYRIDNVIEHYKHQKGNYHIQCFFIDKDAPIIETAKKFAEYIDSLSILP